MVLNLIEKTGAARDTQAKGRAKKLRKASSGKPNFLERAKRTYCECTADAIFAYIIIHNREQDKSIALEEFKKKEHGIDGTDEGTLHIQIERKLCIG